MIPPVDSQTLVANPQFAALHKTLTTRLLNPDGSTKNHPTQTERDARAPVSPPRPIQTLADRLSQELRARRLDSTRALVLASALSNLPLTTSTKPSKASKSSNPSSTRDQPLPADLTDLIILLTLYLTNRSLSPTSATLLTTSPLYTTLPSHLPTISSLLSTHLTALALPLTRLLNPTTNPSFLHRRIPALPSSTSALLVHIAEQRLALQSARAALTPLATSVLRVRTSCAEASIRVLETAKHGAVARHARASAEVLGLQAQTAEGEARMASAKAAGIVYSAEARRALRAYKEHLRDGRARLGMRERDAEAVLGGYGVGREEGKERVLREMARVWGEMEREGEEVRRDIERLRGG